MFIILLDGFANQPTALQAAVCLALFALAAAAIALGKLLCGLVDGVFDAIDAHYAPTQRSEEAQR